MAHVNEDKKKEVARLTKLLTDSPVVAVAQIGGIPAPQMLEMRQNLRAHVKVVGTKNRLLKIAIAEAAKARPGVDALSDKVTGQVALLATDLNPFKLYKNIRAGATMAPLKAGQIAPSDIVVPKGGTPFGPGPIVGELQKVGIPAKIEAGKVVISKDATPVKAGQVVSADLASMLAKLEIKPVELAIRLEAAFEKDTMYGPETLAIDEAAIFAQIGIAVRAAHEISVQTAFPTKQTADALVARAYKSAVSLVVEKGLSVDEAAEAAVTRDYARILASIGKKESDLSEEVKKRLGENISVLSAAASAASASASAAAPAKEEKKEEAGVSEEEAAAGLGALFG